MDSLLFFSKVLVDTKGQLISLSRVVLPEYVNTVMPKPEETEETQETKEKEEIKMCTQRLKIEGA